MGAGVAAAGDAGPERPSERAVVGVGCGASALLAVLSVGAGSAAAACCEVSYEPPAEPVFRLGRYEGQISDRMSFIRRKCELTVSSLASVRGGASPAARPTADC